MSERRCGSIFVREPNELLMPPFVVSGHTHNFDHMTNFCSGLWHCQVFDQIFGDDGAPKLDVDGSALWHESQNVKIRGGTPGAWLLIAANKKHTFTLLEGPGFYQCVYAHRVHTGEIVEEYNGWMGAYR